MKKITVLTLLLACLSVFNGPASAQEKVSAPSLASNLVQGKVPAGDISFEVSVTPGNWSQAKVGQPFTTGYQPTDFTLPSLKENPVPIRYPRWAVQEGWEGTFVIAIEVLTSGEAGRWSVVRSTGYALLDKAATKAIRQWHFHPATEKGRPVVMCIQIPVHFDLREA